MFSSQPERTLANTLLRIRTATFADKPIIALRSRTLSGCACGLLRFHECVKIFLSLEQEMAIMDAVGHLSNLEQPDLIKEV